MSVLGMGTAQRIMLNTVIIRALHSHSLYVHCIDGHHTTIMRVFFCIIRTLPSDSNCVAHRYTPCFSKQSLSAAVQEIAKKNAKIGKMER
jgi:hypothetical protein